MPKRLSQWFNLPVVLFMALLASPGMAGPLQRAANATLKFPQIPPTYGYTTTNAFGTMTFTNPVALVTPPGETNRLFIVQKKGIIVVITNLAVPTRTIFMDISGRVTSSSDASVGGEEGLLGMAFHPGYATNGYFYVFYTGNATTPGVATNQRHDILSRFSVSSGNSSQGDASSELRLIVQYDEANNHNAGDVHFGPDGYLYVSLGDEGGAEGQYGNTQRIDRDFFSAIMRIDVDKRPGSLTPHGHPSIISTSNYAIPQDNPWVNATTFNGLSVNPANVRTEFWAVGMRNPWRFSFDSETGELYLGHVGQGSREWVDIVTKGSNAAWNYWEGNLQRTNSANIPAGFVRKPALIDYAHSSGRVCIIGGIVYRGNRISQLTGAYLYGDYGTGEIWALRHNGAAITQNAVILTDSSAHPSSFGVNPATGDILFTALRGGNNSTINKIIYNTVTNGVAIPPTLAATGAFSDLASLAPQSGIVPYDINVPFWSDNAVKSRWFCITNVTQTFGFSSNANWTFPSGAMWIKHFELVTNTTPPITRKLETRFIIKNTTGVYGVTYRWTNNTGAVLVPEDGLDESIVVNDGGNLRTQVWHYPARNECLSCHTAAAGYALGFNTPQLNRSFDYGTGPTSQLGAMSDAGYFPAPLSGTHLFPALAAATNEGVSREFRIRSYLAANCAQCHQPSGSAQALWDARLSTPTSQAGLINGELENNLGDSENAVIVPGSTEHSILLTRLANPGPGHMPPLATSVINTQAVQLISEWITNDLPSYQSFSNWQLMQFGSTNAPNTGPLEDFDGDQSLNYLEYLTATSPTNAASRWQIGITLSGNAPSINFPQKANRGYEVQAASNLFGAPVWSPLDVSGNEPLFSSTNKNASVIDSPSSNARFYRVRVFEP